MPDRPQSWAAGDWTVADAGAAESVLSHGFAASRLVIGTNEIPVALGAKRAIAAREDARSCRSMRPQRLDDAVRLRLLSVLCGDGGGAGPYPSAGALYPCHPFLVEPAVDDSAVAELRYVDGASGVCRDIGRVGSADLRGILFEEWAWPTGCLVLLVVDFTRVTARYGARGLRFGLIESGLLMSRLLRKANALGLCACALGGFDDLALVRMLGLDPRWYGVAVGIGIGYHGEGDDHVRSSPEDGG